MTNDQLTIERLNNEADALVASGASNAAIADRFTDIHFHTMKEGYRKGVPLDQLFDVDALMQEMRMECADAGIQREPHQWKLYEDIFKTACFKFHDWLGE